MVSNEKTLSAAADDGWISKICLAPADHFGRLSEFDFHHSKSETGDPISER